MYKLFVNGIEIKHSASFVYCTRCADAMKVNAIVRCDDTIAAIRTNNYWHFYERDGRESECKAHGC